MNHATPRIAISLVGLPLLLVTGCDSVGLFDNDTSDWHPAPGRVDRIDPVDLVGLSRTAPEAPDVAMDELLDADIPIEPAAGSTVPLELSQVRRSVLENNLDLRTELVAPSIARANLSAEQAKFESTFFAGYTRNDQGVLTNLEQGEPTNSDEFSAGVRLPLATGGDIVLDTLSTRSDLGVTLPGAEPWESSLRFSISQPLLRGAGLDANTASIRIAGWNRDIADARLKLAAMRLLADADRAYWNMYAAWGELDVRRTQYDLAIAQMELAQRRFDAGDAPQIEVVRARSGVGRTLESIIRADANLRIGQRGLKRIMNEASMPIDGDLTLEPASRPEPLRLDLDGDALARSAVENRMEMLELELQLSIDALTVDLRRNDALPIFGLDYRYSLVGDDSGFGGSYGSLGDSDSHRVGVSGEIPIGNEVLENRLSSAILQRVQRLATKDARALAIRTEVLDALDRLRQAWQSILAARLETLLAARTAEGEQRQFESGLRTSTEVLDAQNRLANAQSREVRALADYQIALVDIAFASGTILGRTQVDFREGDSGFEAVPGGTGGGNPPQPAAEPDFEE